MNRHRAIIITWLVGLFPAVAAVIAMQSDDVAGAPATLNFLGRLTGIAGLGLMLAAAALSCRVPGFDKPFGGLTKLWQLHHWLGGVAFFLLLAHPLLLSLGNAHLSLDAAVATLLPPLTSGAVWIGWLALLLTMGFMASSFSFFGKPRYQRWKWLHRSSGLAIMLALAHTFYLGRTIATPWSTLIWYALAGLAVASLGYRFAFSRFWGRRRYRVEAVVERATDAVELVLKSLDRPLHYSSGQFVYLTPLDRALDAGYGEEHPYTLSSAPEEPVLRIAVKGLGDASRALQHIALGSEVRVEGPYGNFFPEPEETGVGELWIAGGIGIAPFLGRLRHLSNRDEPVDIHLIYCVQDRFRALFIEELEGLAQNLAGFSLSMHYFYREGPLTGDFLRQCCPDLVERRAYVCGPVPLLALARRDLLAAGLAGHFITTEEFELP